MLCPELNHLGAVKHPMCHGWPRRGVGGSWYGNVDSKFFQIFLLFPRVDCLDYKLVSLVVVS